MVVTERPETSFTAVMQARVASPSTWTVQAPQSATPQPYFVPVSPNSSRRYQSNGVDGSPSKDCSWPLTRNLTMACLPLGAVRQDSISDGAPSATSLVKMAVMPSVSLWEYRLSAFLQWPIRIANEIAN